MSDDTQEQGANESTALAQDELASLKQRADLMGLSYHPSISAAKLKEKISAALQGETKPDAEDVKPDTTAVSQEDAVVAATSGTRVKAVVDEETGDTVFGVAETENQKRLRLRNEANEQVRIRVSCLNPNKKDWQGEIFTVGNAAVGTFKKFVPFNTEEGWHVPRMILQAMQERQCQIFVNEKTKNGVTVRRGKQIKEFAIEILPSLTQTELNELARRQAMANGQD